MTQKARIEISGVRVPYEAGADCDAEALSRAKALLRRETGLKAEDARLAKKSVDARRGITFVYTVCAETEAKEDLPSLLENKPGLRLYSEPRLELPVGEKRMRGAPVVVGFGPAGMFAALTLAEAGMKPLVLERGAPVDERCAAVERFVKEGILDPSSNVQFGAGGAGTFSDGKLVTRISDPLVAWVLKTFYELGAPEDILWRSKPHIGTDILRSVVKRADEKIRALGGEIRYHTAASDIGGGSLLADGERLSYDALILAIGHSARDTVTDLIGAGYAVEAKPFSVGVRAEHLQSAVDEALFHAHAGDPALGKGEYQLSTHIGGRGCYTFCMCPGGVVIPSASEAGGVVTNGMSTRARDGRNANAAVCVSVGPEDFGSDPLGAIAFQRALEQKAFAAGGGDYTAPYQTVGDFMNGKSGMAYTDVVPSYRDGRVKEADFEKLFPRFVTETLRAGLADFAKKLRGYDKPSAILTGVETRTSSPVRILRGGDGRAETDPSVFPCGEGAGYAGGITSAAVDGIRAAQRVLAIYRP